MSLKVFISVFPAALCGWMIWKHVTMFTENERLQHKNRTLNHILADIEEEFWLYSDNKEGLIAVEKIISFYKKREPWLK